VSERYPLFLDLAGRRVLLVGAGEVAARRLPALLAAGARVVVVAPRTGPAVAAAAARGEVEWLARSFEPGDVAGAWLVHTATGVADVDAAAVAAADAAGVWAVRASAADRPSPAWSAAAAEQDGVQVAVSGGGDPRRAVAVRDAVAAALAAGELPLRRRRGPAGAGTGRVALVGGGPGDPDLLTVRARRLLRQADVVVADHLAPAGVLEGLDADVEVKYAGKRPGQHSLTQEQINRYLVARAQEGLLVVRLKGGDPFLLGRGGEEALACIEAGIPVEVVPGVTSALAVPAAAGIPVTQRGVTASVLVVSGHQGPAPVLRAAAEAAPDATLVVLMGTATLAETAAALVAAGRPAATPAAVISRGWTPQQRTEVGTLADIADRAGASSPAVVVVGEVVALRAQLGDLARCSAAAGHTLPAHTRGDAVVAP
jgi:uroporphyrin-III C-methyltransferase/precorrin-2 dehydrogenase/sirohydrochlorin ferrochelatase